MLDRMTRGSGIRAGCTVWAGCFDGEEDTSTKGGGMNGSARMEGR